MTYLLIFLTGALGVLGTLIETHEEVLKNGKTKKTLTKWGIVTVTGLGITLSLSLYKQHLDNATAEKLSQENDYLKLSSIMVGPNYYVSISFSDSILIDGYSQKSREIEVAKSNFTRDWNNDIGERDTASDKLLKGMLALYETNFMDSASRRVLFQNEILRHSTLAYLEYFAGVLRGRMDFERDGLVDVLFDVDNFISSLIDGKKLDGIKMTSLPKFSYSKNSITVDGKFENQVRAGTIYASILREMNKSDESKTNLKVYFDQKPSASVVNAINNSLNKIDELQFQVAYDPDAIRWLIVSMKIGRNYTLSEGFEGVRKVWTFKKNFIYNKLPYIGDISSLDK